MKTNVFVVLMIALLAISTGILMLSGCGTNATGGGGGGAARVGNGILYVSSYNKNCIMAFDNANTIEGTCVPDRIISGDATTLNRPNYNGLFIDPDTDKLYVSNWGVPSILVFSNASTLDGNVIPEQTISGASTTLTGPAGIFVKNGKIYVANQGGDDILVFNSSDTGNIAPSATISSELIDSPIGLYVDNSNRLYVVGTYIATPEGDAPSRQVAIFNNASTLNGFCAPEVNISSEAIYAYPTSVWVDEPHNRMFVSARKSNGRIASFDNVNTLTTGTHEPDRVNSDPSFHVAMGIKYDPYKDILFETDDSAIMVNVWDNASTMESRAPDRQITPSVFDDFLIGIAIDPTR